MKICLPFSWWQFWLGTTTSVICLAPGTLRFHKSDPMTSWTTSRMLWIFCRTSFPTLSWIWSSHLVLATLCFNFSWFLIRLHLLSFFRSYNSRISGQSPSSLSPNSQDFLSLRAWLQSPLAKRDEDDCEGCQRGAWEIGKQPVSFLDWDIITW